MPVNYQALGANDRIRKRRYDVLTYHVRNATPAEIAKALDLPIKTVYNDIDQMTRNLSESVSLGIVKEIYTTAFELKIRELEARANKPGISDGAYNSLQKNILDNRMASLKLMGLLSDKVEHCGSVELNTVQIYIPDNGREKNAD